MPRQQVYRDLEQNERRIALMRAAGASLATIALEMGSSEQQIRWVINKPQVANYMMVLSGAVVDGIQDTVELTNEKIKATARRAFEVETQVMEDLVSLGDEYEDPHAKIRAKLGAVATAQDILDRAGNRAPTKVLNAHVHGNIPPQVLENLVDVLKETQAIEVEKEEKGEDTTRNIVING